MVPFVVQAGRGCSTPGHLALALAAEFAPVRPARAEVALDEAAWLVGARHDDPFGQLDALAELTAAHLEAVVLSSAIDDLLLDRVVAGGAGHPLLLAIACSPARRAAQGCTWASSPASTAPSWPTASSPTRCSSIRRAVRCATRARSGWRCRGSCHQVAARILNRIGERAERVGHLGWALRAAELRLALPFDAPTRERLQADLRHVRARLN